KQYRISVIRGQRSFKDLPQFLRKRKICADSEKKVGNFSPDRYTVYVILRNFAAHKVIIVKRNFFAAAQTTCLARSYPTKLW
ncbi:MAG: hypothetical protein LBB79_02700, partial [Prevotellaceae bacterium]|nr:hypothetical protein [Prevotellaceae bacterium]